MPRPAIRNWNRFSCKNSEMPNLGIAALEKLCYTILRISVKEGVKTLLKYDAILFDVDGTLLDSAPGILSTMEETFRQMGVDPAGLDLRRYLGPPLRRTFGEHFLDEADIERATLLYRESYKRRGCHMCQPYPGAARMLGRLRQAGLILCTATSKPTEVVAPILAEQGLAPFFDRIDGASMDASRDTKTDVIRYVLDQPLLRGRRVLMVGDRAEDMRGAADCGLDAAAALYGYGYRQELEPFGPVFYLDSCDQLADLLLGAPAAK